MKYKVRATYNRGFAIKWCSQWATPMCESDLYKCFCHAWLAVLVAWLRNTAWLNLCISKDFPHFCTGSNSRYRNPVWNNHLGCKRESAFLALIPFQCMLRWSLTYSIQSSQLSKAMHKFTRNAICYEPGLAYLKSGNITFSKPGDFPFALVFVCSNTPRCFSLKSKTILTDRKF